jgi:hypothetical protein
VAPAAEHPVECGGGRLILSHERCLLRVERGVATDGCKATSRWVASSTKRARKNPSLIGGAVRRGDDDMSDEDWEQVQKSRTALEYSTADDHDGWISFRHRSAAKRDGRDDFALRLAGLAVARMGKLPVHSTAVVVSNINSIQLSKA